MYNPIFEEEEDKKVRKKELKKLKKAIRKRAYSTGIKGIIGRVYELFIKRTPISALFASEKELAKTSK